MTQAQLTVDKMVEALKGVEALAWSMAKKFHQMNPVTNPRDLYEVAMFGFRVAVLRYDPTRESKPGVKAQFSTLGYHCAYHELIDFCRVESARGMHVPDAHDPYFAPRPHGIREDWHEPGAEESVSAGAEAEDFWSGALRSLHARERRLVQAVYRDGVLLYDVAKELGMSRQRARQILARALDKLRRQDDLRALVGYPKYQGRAVA